MRFIEQFVKIVSENQDRIALDDGQEAITYREFHDLSSRVYAYLKKNGIGKEDFVMIDLPRSIHTVVAILGVIKAGAAFVPMESSYPRERAAFIKEDAGCCLVLTEELMKEVYDTPPLSGYEITGLHDAAYVVYTSGSTGNPKGVIHEYGNVDQMMETCTTDPTHINTGFVPPFYFVASVIKMIGYICCGDTSYIISHDTLRNFGKLKAFIYDKKLNEIYLPPSLLRLYTDPSPYLDMIVTGSEPANGLYYEGGKPKIINSYSMTEAGFRVFYGELDKKYDVAPVGKPVLDVSLFLCDEEGHVVEGAGQGEICFVNEYVRGYINLPEKTKEAWRDGVYHTGDIARRDEEGRYYIVGRIDDMIKINGNRIEPAEIEAKIQELTGLKKVIAKGFTLDEDRALICVYYIREEAEKLGAMKGGTLTIDKSKLKTLLPDYMIPAYYVALDAFPLNANGKIAKKELKCPDVSDYETEYVEPANELEAYFSEKMAKVLKRKRFSARDDFFVLGGSSIKAITFVAECDEYPITTDLLYEYPTPQLLAVHYTEQESDVDLEKENELAKKGSYRLIPSQLMNIASPDGGSRRSSDITTLRKIKDGVDIERLRRSIDDVIRCHPALFTRLCPGENGMPCQKYDETLFEETPVIIVDGEQFDQYLNEKYRSTEELSVSKPYTSEILRYQESYYYYFSVTHLIADGESNRLFLNDIEERFADETYVPKPDYWFLTLKRYWEKQAEKSEKITPMADAEDVSRYKTIPFDRKVLPVNGSVLSVPDAFRPDVRYDGVFFAAACLLAQCRCKGTNMAALYSVSSNRGEKAYQSAFGILIIGLFVSVEIDENDTPSGLLSKVRKAFRSEIDLPKIASALGFVNSMMRFNFLNGLSSASLSSDVFAEDVPIRREKKEVYGAIATNVVYTDEQSVVGLRIVYSTDVYDTVTVEKYRSEFYKAVEFLKQDKPLKEFLHN